MNKFSISLAAGVMILMAASPSFAQTETANSGSESVGAASIEQNSYGAPGVNYSGGYSVANTPDLGSLYATPTAPCIVTGGIGVSAPGFGIEGQAGVRDQVCTEEGEIKMAYATQPRNVGDMMECMTFSLFRDSRALAGDPCPVSSYPKNQQDVVRKQQIVAGFLNADGTPKVAKVLQQVAQVETPKQKFCATLNPNNPADRGYLLDCN